MCFISISLRNRLTFLFSLFVFAAAAQIEQEGRLEVPINDQGIDIEAPRIISLDSAGLLSFRRFASTGDDQVELMRLDTAFRVQWRGFFPVNSLWKLLSVKANATTAFFLFKYGVGSSIGDFAIITVRLSDGNYTVMPIRNFIPFNYFEMEITPDAVWLAGYFNYRPMVLYVDLRIQKAKILPGFFNEVAELTQLKAQSDGLVDVIMMARNMDRQKCLWIRSYDREGNLVKTTIVTPDEKKNFIFGRSVKTDDNRTMVVGVYGRFTDYSRGIFVSEINTAGEYTTQYYNFGDLKNFFSYLKAKREQRIKSRIERRKVKGRKIKFNYRLLVHELIPYNNQVVMLGEAFYPHYAYRSRGIGGIGVNAYYAYSSTRGDLVFDGFQYTHAVVIGFDPDGELLWDNSFEIKDVRTFQLEQYVKMSKQPNRLGLLYPYQNSVRSKIISGNEVVESNSDNAMKTNFPNDFVKDKETQVSKLEYWYDNHFFVYGVQTIRSNIDKEINRKVFFINKIRFK